MNFLVLLVCTKREPLFSFKIEKKSIEINKTCQNNKIFNTEFRTLIYRIYISRARSAVKFSMFLG